MTTIPMIKHTDDDTGRVLEELGISFIRIPTVVDRIAQTVVKGYLEPILEEHFHTDSYRYRSGKSAIEAVGVARLRCW